MFDEENSPERRRAMTALLERLSSRLGEKAVLQPQLQPDAQPEFACRYEPCLFLSSPRWGEGPGVRGKAVALRRRSPHSKGASPSEAVGERVLMVRPPCLQDYPTGLAVLSIFPGGPPIRFEWQEEHYIVARCWGPERIETGWWRGDDVRRDYYLVETTA